MLNLALYKTGNNCKKYTENGKIDVLFIVKNHLFFW